LKPKDTFRQCENCPEMAVVPAGSFMMGSPPGEKDRAERDGPQQVVTINKPFAVAKPHVTIDQFAGKPGIKDRNSTSDREFVAKSLFCADGSHPVVCVNWNDAKIMQS
jgi:formylglycine-generating enzyme required for sulfatase activity